MFLFDDDVFGQCVDEGIASFSVLIMGSDAKVGLVANDIYPVLLTVCTLAVTLNARHQRSAGPALAGPEAPSTEVQEGCTEKRRELS